MFKKSKPHDDDDRPDRFGLFDSLLAAADRTRSGIRNLWKALVWQSGITKLIFAVLEKCYRASRRIGFAVEKTWNQLLQKTVYSSSAEHIVENATNLKDAADKIRSGAVLNVLEAFESSRIGRHIARPFRWTIQLVYPIFYFGLEWLSSRNYRQLMLGVPAVLLMMPLLFCLIRLPLYGTNAKAQHYQKAVNEALRTEDYASADLFYRKLNQIQQRPSDMMIFQSAVALEVQGEHEEARRRMESIARLDQPGFAAAHAWLAHAILNAAANNRHLDADIIENVETHLQHAIALQPRFAEAAILLAEIYQKQGKTEKAKLLVKEHEDHPDTQIKIKLARLFLILNDKVRCASLAAEVDRELAQKNTKSTSPSDFSPSDFADWALAAELRGDYEKLDAILQQGRAAYPDNKVLRSGAVRLSFIQLQQKQEQGEVSAIERFNLIQELLAIEPENQFAVMNLRNWAMFGDSETSQSAVELLEVQSDHSVAALDAMAIIAVDKNDYKSARQHFRRLVERDPENANALNNLAWILAHDEPTDLKKAIELVDRAIELNSKNPHYRDTKGHVLMKQEKWMEAISELELAMNGLPDNKSTHVALAQSYEKIGKNELAEFHFQLSQSP